MKLRLNNQAGTLRHLAVTVLVLLLSAATLGQQTVVPGSSALETEESDEVRRYAVELIIFEYTDPSSAGTEVFEPEKPPPSAEEDLYFNDTAPDPLNDFYPAGVDGTVTANSMEAGGADFADDTDDRPPALIDEPLESVATHEQSGLKLLGAQDYVLNNEYKRLERLDAYRPLMRTAWIQPTLEKDVTVPIKLRRLGDPPLRLSGTVTLYLSRYLHLVIDIALEEKSPVRVFAAGKRPGRFGDRRSRFESESEYITPSTFYRIDEDRIVKNGELRYFDHPRFGVLAKITRIEENDEGNNATDLVATPITDAN